MFKIVDFDMGPIIYNYITFEFYPDKTPYKEYSFAGVMQICHNPLCTDKDVACSVKYANTPENITDKTGTYSFDIDIDKKKVFNTSGSGKVLLDNKKFAKMLLSELTEQNWDDIRNVFFRFKYYLSDNFNIDDIPADITFPDTRSLDDGMMIFYDEIIPFAKQFFIESNPYDFLIMDQYCLKPNCTCQDATLTFIPYKKNKSFGKNEITIKFDYQKRKWELIVDHSQQMFKIDDSLNKLIVAIPDIPVRLKKRHKNLKAIYKKYKHKKDKHDLVIEPVSRKTGRNEPCPCGSGKKYKKCCGR